MPRKCTYEGCLKGASYNCEGEKQGLYCKTHMGPNMIDVVHQTCQYSGCDKHSTSIYEANNIYTIQSRLLLCEQ